MKHSVVNNEETHAYTWRQDGQSCWRQVVLRCQLHTNIHRRGWESRTSATEYQLLTLLYNTTNNDVNLQTKITAKRPMATWKIFIRGFGWSIVQGVWGTEVPQWVQGQSPGRGSSRRGWNSLQTLFRYFDCRNDRYLKISHNSPPNS